MVKIIVKIILLLSVITILILAFLGIKIKYILDPTYESNIPVFAGVPFHYSTLPYNEVSVKKDSELHPMLFFIGDNLKVKPGTPKRTS